MKVTLNTDGGVRTGGVRGPTQGRTGRAAIAAVIKDEDGNVLFKQGMRLSASSTVNEAEYSGIVYGLFNAHKLGATEVEVRSDSQLVVNQINGDWQVKQPSLFEFLEEVRVETGKFDKVTFVWVPREQNQHADMIAREILDDEIRNQ